MSTTFVELESLRTVKSAQAAPNAAQFSEADLRAKRHILEMYRSTVRQAETAIARLSADLGISQQPPLYHVASEPNP